MPKGRKKKKKKKKYSQAQAEDRDALARERRGMEREDALAHRVADDWRRRRRLAASSTGRATLAAELVERVNRRPGGSMYIPTDAEVQEEQIRDALERFPMRAGSADEDEPEEGFYMIVEHRDGTGTSAGHFRGGRLLLGEVTYPNGHRLWLEWDAARATYRVLSGGAQAGAVAAAVRAEREAEAEVGDHGMEDLRTRHETALARAARTARVALRANARVEALEADYTARFGAVPRDELELGAARDAGGGGDSDRSPEAPLERAARLARDRGLPRAAAQLEALASETKALRAAGYTRLVANVNDVLTGLVPSDWKKYWRLLEQKGWVHRTVPGVGGGPPTTQFISKRGLLLPESQRKLGKHYFTTRSGVREFWAKKRNLLQASRAAAGAAAGGGGDATQRVEKLMHKA